RVSLARCSASSARRRRLVIVLMNTAVSRKMLERIRSSHQNSTPQGGLGKKCALANPDRAVAVSDGPSPPYHAAKMIAAKYRGEMFSPMMFFSALVAIVASATRKTANRYRVRMSATRRVVLRITTRLLSYRVIGPSHREEQVCSDKETA